LPAKGLLGKERKKMKKKSKNGNTKKANKKQKQVVEQKKESRAALCKRLLTEGKSEEEYVKLMTPFYPDAARQFARMDFKFYLKQLRAKTPKFRSDLK
jgi:hypothetical protein